MMGFGFEFIGWETNNVIEIEGLFQGIVMLKENGWMPIIIEGDSQVVIQMEINLHNVMHNAKVA